MRYAIVENGTVVNIIEASAEFAAQIGAVQTDTANIGYAFDESSGQFTAPPEPEPEPSPPKILTKYQFRQLFTFDERVAIDNYESSALSSQHKAMFRTWMKDLELSAEVHADNPDLAPGIMALESMGLLDPGRAAEIILELES